MQVPKDLAEVEPKFLFDLTKRQVVCFGSGALVGVPLFFLTRGAIGTSAAMVLMIVAMSPFFLLAMYKRNGQPLEKMMTHIIQCRFVRPAQRPYQTDNFYALVERQNELRKEVKSIVQGTQTRKAHKSREKADRSRESEGREG